MGNIGNWNYYCVFDERGESRFVCVLGYTISECVFWSPYSSLTLFIIQVRYKSLSFKGGHFISLCGLFIPLLGWFMLEVISEKIYRGSAVCDMSKSKLFRDFYYLGCSQKKTYCFGMSLANLVRLILSIRNF